MIGLRNHPPWPYIEAVENGLLEGMEALYRAVALYLDTGSSPSKSSRFEIDQVYWWKSTKVLRAKTG